MLFQTQLLAWFSLMATGVLVAASPVALTDLTPRQATAAPVDASLPSMSDADGNIVSFNATGVYQAATANGV